MRVHWGFVLRCRPLGDLGDISRMEGTGSAADVRYLLYSVVLELERKSMSIQLLEYISQKVRPSLERVVVHRNHRTHHTKHPNFQHSTLHTHIQHCIFIACHLPNQPRDGLRRYSCLKILPIMLSIIPLFPSGDIRLPWQAPTLIARPRDRHARMLATAPHRPKNSFTPLHPLPQRTLRCLGCRLPMHYQKRLLV
jgi:hypothetical protein